MRPAVLRGGAPKHFLVVECVLCGRVAGRAAIRGFFAVRRQARDADLRRGRALRAADRAAARPGRFRPLLGLCHAQLAGDELSRPPSRFARRIVTRAALQLVSIQDRFARRIRGEPGKLEDGGLAIEALALIRRNGLVARADFHDIVDSDPIFSSIDGKLSHAADPAEKLKLLGSELKSSLGETPTVTHLDGEPVSPQELARAALGQQEWAEFDLSRDGAEGPGPPHDPDARADTQVSSTTLR